MSIAIEAGIDLVPICACLILIGLLMAVFYTFQAAAGAFDVSFLGVRPFAHIATLIRNTVLRWCEAGIADLSGVLTNVLDGAGWLIRFQSSALATFGRAIGSSVYDLWYKVIPAAERATIRLIRQAEGALIHRIETLAHLVKTDVFRLEKLVAHEAARVLGAAETYAAKWINHAVTALRHEIAADLHTVERTISGLEHRITREVSRIEGDLAAEARQVRAYTDAHIAAALRATEGEIALAIAPLKTGVEHALNAAESAVTRAAQAAEAIAAGVLSQAMSAINAARAEASQATAAALHDAMIAVGDVEREAQTLAGQALADAEAALGAAVGSITDLIGETRRALETELANYTPASLAALAATVTGLAAVVATTFAETGLDNPGCRPKFRGVCGTNLNGWLNLLAGLVALEIGFNFDQLAEIAAEGFARVDDLIDAIS